MLTDNIKLSKRKNKILIIDDNEINRDILSAILEDEYDILAADNGKTGIHVLEEHYFELSLIILDVYMPICNGYEFLTITQKDDLLSNVPVIVATASDKKEDEVKCLRMGASDFITKPYNAEVVLARVHSIIKLKESMTTLSKVEFDDLTGLYTITAFHHHVQRILNNNPDQVYNLACMDVQGFKMINEIFGEKTGDAVLQHIAKWHKKFIPEGFTARQGDKFFTLYISSLVPENADLIAWMDAMTSSAPAPNVVTKLGVYHNIDKSLPISILCDRAVLTATSIKGSFVDKITWYDEKLQKKIIEEQSMENDFENAIQTKEFKVWYQPKIDGTTEQMTGAEALVRWQRHENGMRFPGIFIPLFERDGLISKLDEYMFREVCLFQKRRILENKAVVPVSINLSRNSVYIPDTVERYKKIVKEIGVPMHLVQLELTESAFIDGGEVTSLINKFHTAGFELHMDDFGSGYSSLSSLIKLPFDVVKLDKTLIDDIGSQKGETVICHMINIAHEIGMKTVAEGAETRPQVDFLEDNCIDMIQGYYFSAPVCEEKFVEMLDHPKEAKVNVIKESKKGILNEFRH